MQHIRKVRVIALREAVREARTAKPSREGREPNVWALVAAQGAGTRKALFCN